MATTIVSTKLNLDIGNFKSKMQDAKKSIEDLQKSFKSAGGKSWEPFKSTDLGKKIDNIKTKASNLGETFKALPGPAKAGAVIIAVTASLKKLYDLGKQRFFEGLSDIKDTISPVLNGITTAINTVKQAFTEITGFNFNFTSIITTGVNFEAQMKKVATIAGSIGTELDQLISKARELGAATTFSAKEVGEAMQYMAMAGWSTSEMLEGVQSTLNLAKIGSTDLGIASDILTDDLTALGMGANQAGDFADKLAATITRSNTDVVLFGESMKQTGAVAGALGASMTDLSTSIGLMANAGIKGSKAGMSLKNLFTNMANPTDQMSAALEKLGMTADKSGSYLKTTADGCTDLEATVKSLKEGTEGMTRSQKASLIATVAGKNALPGVMSLINASTEEYNSLSEAIDNSTSTVAMFNENMSVLGLSGKGATDAIQNMKQVFSDTELSATALGLSSKDLGFSISLLGDDSKVTKDNVEDLLDVIENMNNASGKTDTAWRNIGNAENLDLNKYIDYNSTLSEIDNSIVGLSGSQKDHVKSLIKENMTVSEANKVLKQYGLSAKQVSLSTMTTSEKMDYLRNSLKGMSDEQMKSELSNLGLADSFEEVNEIVDMSDDKYSKYKKNLETIQGLSDRMAKSIDETTKSAFFALSSAMEDTLLGAFDRLKPALLSGSEALTDFFSTWRGGDDGNYSFSGFEKGLNDLEIKVAQASNNIPSLMDNMFSGINRFIKGGALDSFLNMGTDIVQNIAKGIINNKENITESISVLIEKICSWINTNGPTIQEAGVAIIDSIKTGIANNASNVDSAVDTVFNLVNSFLIAKQDLLQTTGSIVGATFIKGMVKGIAIEGVNSIGNGIYAIVNTVGQFTADFAGVGINLATSFVDSFMGFIFDCGLWDGVKQSVMDFDAWLQEYGLGGGTTKAQDAKGNVTNNQNQSNLFKDIGDGFDEFKKSASKKIGEARETISTKFGEIQESCDEFGNNVNKFFTETLPEFFSPNNLGTELGTFVGTVAKSLVGIGDGIAEFMSELPEKGNQLYASLETSIGDAVHNFSIWLETSIKGLPGKMWGWLQGLFTNNSGAELAADAKKSGQDVGESLSDGLLTELTNLPGKAWESFCGIDEKVGEWGNNLGDKIKEAGGNIIDGLKEGFKTKKQELFDWCDEFKESFVSAFKTAFGIHSPSTVMRDEVGTFIPQGIAEGITQGITYIMDAIGEVIEAIQGGLSDIWDKITGKDKDKELINIDTEKLSEAQEALRGLGTTATGVTNTIRTQFISMAGIVRSQCTNMANICRNQFINLTNIVRNQCVNQANIVRNQFTNISNIVRNQSQNARNSATTSFISMKKVISTQVTEARTKVVEKMMSINAVVNTQAWKARDNATRAFMSLAAVVRTQMSNALSSVRNAMSQIASATNRTLTTKVNVSKTITTTNVAKSIQAKAQTFSLAATRSLGGINSLATASYGSPVAFASTSSGVSGSTVYGKSKEATKTNSKPVYFDISIPIDGKEIAKASAKYMDGELKIINNRNNRKKGV